MTEIGCTVKATLGPFGAPGRSIWLPGGVDGGVIETRVDSSVSRFGLDEEPSARGLDEELPLGVEPRRRRQLYLLTPHLSNRDRYARTLGRVRMAVLATKTQVQLGLHGLAVAGHESEWTYNRG